MKINLEDVITLPAINEGIATGEVTIDGFVPASEGEIKQDPVIVTVTENSSISIKAADVDREEREAQGLTPWDGLAQVDVTVDVPAAGGAGWITVMADKEYASMLEAEELNMMDVKGALFSWNASTGKYHVWNADEVKVWDWDLDCSANYGEVGSPAVPSWVAEVEFPTNEYGEVIAVCAGKGLWVSTKWDSEQVREWCSFNSPMYSFQWDCFDLSGAEVAKKLYAANKDLTGSIFATIKEFESIENDGTKGHYFLPSRSEILQVVCACADEDKTALEGLNHYTYENAYYNATHIIALSSVWSASQGVYASNVAYYLYHSDSMMGIDKSTTYTSVVCLHFGDTLVSDAVDQGIGVE